MKSTAHSLPLLRLGFSAFLRALGAASGFALARRLAACVVYAEFSGCFCRRFVGFEHFRDGYGYFFVLAGVPASLLAACALEIFLGFSLFAWGWLGVCLVLALRLDMPSQPYKL